MNYETPPRAQTCKRPPVHRRKTLRVKETQTTANNMAPSFVLVLCLFASFLMFLCLSLQYLASFCWFCVSLLSFGFTVVLFVFLWGCFESLASRLVSAVVLWLFTVVFRLWSFCVSFDCFASVVVSSLVVFHLFNLFVFLCSKFVSLCGLFASL